MVDQLLDLLLPYLFVPRMPWLDAAPEEFKKRDAFLTLLAQHRPTLAKSMARHSIDPSVLFKLQNLTYGFADEIAGRDQLRKHIDCLAALQALHLLLPKRSSGRRKPSPTSRDRDRRIYESCIEGSVREVARTLNMSENEIRKAKDRERKRRQREAARNAVNPS